MSTSTVSNATELKAALTSAKAGDEILLEAGEYGSFNFDGYTYSDYVTVRSADEKLGAKFDSITVIGSSHIRIDGVHVDSPSNGSIAGKLVTVDGGSTHIEFLNSEVNGKVDSEYHGYYGIHSGEATDVRFEGNYIHDVNRGVLAAGTTQLVVAENNLDYLGDDGMKFVGVTGVLIENNFGPGHVFPAPDAHLDFIQFQGSNSSDIVIRGNVVLPQVSYTAQGIFLDDASYNNVLIENNIIYNALIRGISVTAGSNVIARNNTVLTVPGEGHKASIVSLPSGGISENNVIGFYKGGFSGSNLLVEWDDPNGAYAYDKVFVNASAGWGVTLEDLRPTEGSPAGFGSGLGAEARLYELLEGSAAGPDARDDAISVTEDGSATFDPRANDSDPGNEALELVAVGTASHGSVEINADGTITYAPDADFFGADSFTYDVRNKSGGSDTAQVTITVTPVDDDAPVARDDSFRVLQGGEIIIDLLANDFDPDGTEITFAGLDDGVGTTGKSGTPNGTLTDLGNGRFSYVAADDAIGSETFSYTIRDASGATDSATVTVSIDERGSIPAPVFAAFEAGSEGSAEMIVVPHDAAYMLAEGTLELAFVADALGKRQGLFSKDSSNFDNGGHLTVLLEGDDVFVRLQSTSASYDIRVQDVVTIGQTHHLALAFGSGGMQLYIDGELAGSNGYTGGLIGNSEPIVIGANQWGSGNEVANKIQDPFAGTVTVTNLYGEALDAGQVEYLGKDGSNPEPDANTAPIAKNDTAGTDQDVPVVVDVLANDSDAENDPVDVASVGSAKNGTTGLNADGTVTYTPDAGFFGTDSFTYEVSDGDLSSSATVTVTVEQAAQPEPEPGGTYVSTSAELLSALGSAAGGETIILRDGDYGAVSLKGIRFSSEVTIASETPLGAVFDSLQVRDSSYLKIDGIHVDHPTDGARYTALVEIAGNSHHVSFVNSEVNGSIDSSFDGAYGIRVNTGTSFIEVSGNSVHNVRHGAVFFGSSDLTVSENSFENVGEDSMKFGGVLRALIENNSSASLYRSVDSSVHHDFIQFQGDGTDTIIRGNTFLLAESGLDSGKVVQGIFLKDGVFRNVLIEDNLIYTNTVNGIYVQSDAGTGGDITIRQNTVLSPPDISNWGDSDIRIISLAGDYLVENNIVDRVVDKLGTGTVRNNLKLQWEDPDAPNHYGDVYLNATAGSSATIKDFQPVPGGPGDFGSGMGAEQRLEQLTTSTLGDRGATKTGTDSNDVLLGGAGDDRLFGGLGDDILDAGACEGGWQYLYGESGSDTYLYGRDGGKVFVLSGSGEGEAPGDVDRFVFEDLAFADARFSAHDYSGTGSASQGVALVVSWNDGTFGGQVRFGQEGRYIERFEFADGVVLNTVKIADPAGGTTRGSDGNDLLLGGAGRDYLRSGIGDDILDAGATDGGWQYLYGEGGSDTYLYGRDGGKVFVLSGSGESEASGDVDRFVFEDLSFADARFSTHDYARTGSASQGEALVIDWNDGTAGGQLRFGEGGRYIESFEFADGTAFEKVIFAERSDGNTTGTDSADLMLGSAGNDKLRGGLGDDILDAGAGGGWQYLYGEGGSDTYLYGRDGGKVFVLSGSGEGEAPGDVDRFVFEDLAFADARFSTHDYAGTGSASQGVALVIQWKDGGAGGQVRFGQEGRCIESYEFADGTILDSDEILALI